MKVERDREQWRNGEMEEEIEIEKGGDQTRGGLLALGCRRLSRNVERRENTLKII